MAQQYILCADGACSGNPGPGGFGWELWASEPTASGAPVMIGRGRAPETTNNIMELLAALQGIRALTTKVRAPGHVKLRLDSEYVLNGIFEWMEGWKARGWKNASRKPVKNKELWMKLDHVLEDAKAEGYTFEADWVKGHNGNIGNERVDDIAVEERDKATVEFEHCDVQKDDVREELDPGYTERCKSLADAAGISTEHLKTTEFEPSDLLGVPKMPGDPSENLGIPESAYAPGPSHGAALGEALASISEAPSDEIHQTQVDLMKTILDLHHSGDYSVKQVIQQLRENKVALGL